MKGVLNLIFYGAQKIMEISISQSAAFFRTHRFLHVLIITSTKGIRNISLYLLLEKH